MEWFVKDTLISLLFIYIFISLIIFIIGMMGGMMGTDIKSCSIKTRIEYVFPAYSFGCYMSEPLVEK